MPGRPRIDCAAEVWAVSRYRLVVRCRSWCLITNVDYQDSGIRLCDIVVRIAMPRRFNNPPIPPHGQRETPRNARDTRRLESTEPVPRKRHLSANLQRAGQTRHPPVHWSTIPVTVRECPLSVRLAGSCRTASWLRQRVQWENSASFREAYCQRGAGGRIPVPCSLCSGMGCSQQCGDDLLHGG